jgi:hypothetical protein
MAVCIYMVLDVSAVKYKSLERLSPDFAGPSLRVAVTDGRHENCPPLNYFHAQI